MLTHKSLVVSFALILALACTSILAASAHSTLPVAPSRSIGMNPHGIPAIPALTRNQNLLSFLDVTRYIRAKGFIGGPTLNGPAPTLQRLQLTNIAHLFSLLHTPLPAHSDDEQVYYAHLAGPFLVLPNLPLPVLSTLLPSMSNLPAFLPHLSNLASLGLWNILPPPHAKMPDLSHWQSSGHPFNLGNWHNHAHAKPDKNVTILADAYEVFDAHNGNLLAWG